MLRIGDKSPVEFWIPVLNYEGLYAVSDCGRVKSLKQTTTIKGDKYIEHERVNPSRVLNPDKNKQGYLRVSLYKNGVPCRFSVHKLVSLAFSPKREGQINHKDGIKSNNTPCNLEWVTPKGNCQHRAKVLGKGRGEDQGLSKLKEKEVKVITQLLKEGLSQAEIGRMFDVSRHTIFRISRGDNWNWLTGIKKEEK